ncbi:hypothetical protein CEUSTIGMA_g6062.t1 [Chlamydomonas eustigma]|uniref:J domain-containing protein n=1 Tax=Chlamydomonas eustigma TaxID=1157962 RepID=A0A250X6B5_9CHLO|nr:hypothetical protein CEUSTIGMA_g6062.t1 [Chlamydomonas eustigma]|eukprot:GAX78623.1 hypothetical protein CEUSTIGMA_g6062.t1 [Chlamydomonas eustigma]
MYLPFCTDYYELLGLKPGANDEEIKSAFRRRALETHPDVSEQVLSNSSFVPPTPKMPYLRSGILLTIILLAFVSQPDAEQLFMECKEAYETLSDADRRREYDRVNRLGRRLGFFQDVEEEGWGSSRTPFRWSQVGVDPDEKRGSERQPRWGRGDADEDADEDGGNSSGEEGREDSQERLRELLLFLDGQGGGAGGTLRQWQRGGNPWGTSTSDIWHRQVERQTRDPSYGRGGFRDAGSDRFTGLPGEWSSPSRRNQEEDWSNDRVPGWTPPGREEWRSPGRQFPDGDEEEGRRKGGGGSRRSTQWGDDGGFRGKPL